MSEKYEPKKGNRVRVVLEGEVRYVNGRVFTVGGITAYNSIDPAAAHVVSVEKLEPHVEVFGPGDVVRGKHGYIFTVGKDGWAFDHLDQQWFRRRQHPFAAFTSRDYTRVDLP